MPILPPMNAAAYDTLNVVLNAARGRLNDKIESLQAISGKVLDNGNYFSLQAVNSAWRKTQDALADMGYSGLTEEVVISALPQVSSIDPGVQTWLSWSGYFDGQNFFAQPALPPDFTHPIKVWERWTGYNNPFSDPPMEKMLAGLPAILKTTNIRFWEWRGDAIYMPGSQIVEDLRIRYIRYLADFSDSNDVQWFAQPVPIVRCSDGFSWLICAEFVGARGDQKRAAMFTQNGMLALNSVMNRDIIADQHVDIRRRPRSGRGFGRNWY